MLLLSGIGPREHLERFQIPTRINLPGVGRNLQDHLFAVYDVAVDEDISGGRQMGLGRFAAINPINYLTLLVAGNGPLADSGLGATGFVRTKLAKDGRPDLQIVTWSINYGIDFGIRSAEFAGLKKEAYERIYGPMEHK